VDLLDVTVYILGGLFGVILLISIVALPFAIKNDIEYGNKFEIECNKKGGVVHHPYKSNRICLPKGVIIPVEVK
jgi:hypothetical protein